MDLQFFDFNGLSDSEKCHLTNILQSDSAKEALKLPWVPTEHNSDIDSTPVTESPLELQNPWYNAMAHSYHPQIMTSMCGEWSTSALYNMSNGHLQQFLPRVAYPQPDYNFSEIHEVNYTNRDSGRRNSRGKGMRRENYNHVLNPVNEMPTGYVTEQGQFHQQQIPVMYIYSDQHPVSPQHSVAGQIYYSPAMYSSTVLQSTTHQYAQSMAYPTHHQVSENRFVQQSPTVSLQPCEGNVKPPTESSIREQTGASVGTTCQQVNQNDKTAQSTNIVVANVASNNELKSPVDKENTANREAVVSNGEVSPDSQMIEQDIKLPVNKNSKEENEVPLVNIIGDTKVKRNRETDKKDKEENISTVQVTVKTTSDLVSKAGEIEKEVEENITNKGDKTAVQTLNESSAAPSVPLSMPMIGTQSTITRSWASVLKNNSTDIKTSSSITTHIDSLHQNGLPKTAQKEITTADCTKNQNTSSNTSNTNDKTLQNGVLENFYDDPNLFRMGEFLLRYEMDKQTVSLLPRGLTNRSNYCYINSILQALLACPLFYNLLIALPHPNNCGKLNKHSTTPLIDNMVRFVREFTPLSETARMPRKDRAFFKRGEETVIDSGVALEPSYVYTMLKYTSAAGVFPVEGRQEDAEEFLSCLLNGINDEMLELMKLANNEQNTVVANVENINHGHDEEEWKVIGPKNKGSITRCTELERTPLSDIFRGQLRSRVSRAGEQSTDNVQPFFTLQLDIEKAESVKHALEILVGKDQLEGMTCSKTKKQIEAWKQVTLEELPVILVLHLKWFVYKFNGCSKILKTVEFPVDLKIDGKILSPNTAKKLTPKQKQYKLFAVTYHDGKEASKGHYVTDAFNVGYGGWVRYDDSSAKGVSEYNVLRPTPPRVPYLLYYRRSDTIGNSNTTNNNRPR